MRKHPITAIRTHRNPYIPVSYTHLDVYKRQEEQYNPDRTILTLAFTQKQAEKTSRKKDVYKRQLRHGPNSYGRQQWGILHNGGNPDAATPREGRRPLGRKLLS